MSQFWLFKIRFQKQRHWALKTFSENFSFRASEGSPELFQRMFPDSHIAQYVTMSKTKVAYMIGYGLGPYFHQRTIDDILRSPDTYYTIHIDETTTAQVKKQMDVLVRCFSDTDGNVKVRFLKALVFQHAFAETVADKLWRTLQVLGLPLKNLLSISSDGPNVNKVIKANINTKLQGYFKRQLVDIQSCQLHVVHNTFRKVMKLMVKM